MADVLPRRVGAGYLAAWVAPVALPLVALPRDRLLPATDAPAKGRRLHGPAPVLVHPLGPLAHHPPVLMVHHPPAPMAIHLAPAIRAACLQPAAARIATAHTTRRPLAVHPLAVRRSVAR